MAIKWKCAVLEFGNDLKLNIGVSNEGIIRVRKFGMAPVSAQMADCGKQDAPVIRMKYDAVLFIPEEHLDVYERHSS